MTARRVGIISKLWPPRYGGGERYLHDLARVLAERGLDVRVFCGTEPIAGRDNGVLPATCYVDPRLRLGSSWSKALKEGKAERAAVLAEYSFMDAAVRWAREQQIHVALLGHPFSLTPMFHTRELPLQLKAGGIRVGLVHLDLSYPIERALLRTYRDLGRSWEAAAQVVGRELARLVKRGDPNEVYYEIGSPLFFRPDFVIACSAWSMRFIDPAGSVPQFVFYPPLDRAHWSGVAPQAERLERRDILLVNPQSRKGPEIMASLVAAADPAWTFRILQGGWGDSFAEFVPMVAQTAAVQERRVEFRERVPDMREAYRAAGVLVFPSRIEGYGMTAVEPMFAGTPVVSSNYPAILEAVGDGALTLCPFSDPPDRWREAVRTVLADPAPWRARALAWALQLDDRRQSQSAALVDFVRSQR